MVSPASTVFLNIKVCIFEQSERTLVAPAWDVHNIHDVNYHPAREKVNKRTIIIDSFRV